VNACPESTIKGGSKSSAPGLRTIVDGQGAILSSFVGAPRELLDTEQTHANRLGRSARFFLGE
jgi:hypothetical protein